MATNQIRGNTQIISGSITNTEINASAGIELSKLEALTASRAVEIDGSGELTASAVTSTELNYLGGVTSAIQTQIDGKLSTTLTDGDIYVGNGSNVATAVTMSGDITITNAGVAAIASGVILDADVNASAAITLSKLAATTANRALVSDGSGFITVSAVTDTEVGYLDGVTSNIQTQLNALSTGYNRREKVINYITDNTAAPPTEVSGDRYILSHDGGAPNAAWDGAAANDLVEFNGSTWDATTPVEGWIAYNDTSNTDYLQVDDGTPQWEERAVQSTALTDSNIWVGSGSNVAVERAVTGDIAISNTGVTSIASGVIVNADVNASAAISADKLADGSTNAIVTLTQESNWDTHLSSDGSDHSFINQSVTTSATPSFAGVTLTSDVTSSAAIDWDLLDNNASALSFDATGKAGILAIVTTDSSEGVTMSGSLNIGASTAVSSVLDEDNMASDSATALATQQSIKAYVDATVIPNPSFADGEIPTGLINSSNTTYTVGNAPSPAGSLKVYLNGIRQRLTTDYTLSSTTITMTTAPTTGDNLYVDYRY